MISFMRLAFISVIVVFALGAKLKGQGVASTSYQTEGKTVVEANHFYSDK